MQPQNYYRYGNRRWIFELTTIQTDAEDSLQEVYSEGYTFERRNEILATPHGYSAEIWAQLAEQGVLGIGLAEDTAVWAAQSKPMVVMEQIGGVGARNPS